MSTMRRGSMPAPTNKRNRWRVYGPGDDFQDWPSENKAYEFVRLLTGTGGAASVYVWESGRWVHFEDVLPVGKAQER
jgi:hypothetical protein